MKEKLAVYAGTFDPLTHGHRWMIEQGAELFDRLIVAVGVNPEKECMFSVEERLEMIRESTQSLPNIEVSFYPNQYLVRYAQSVGADSILRGLRTAADYESERAMRHINDDLSHGIITVFLMPPRELAEVSSSRVKGLIGPEGWEAVVERYVPEPVFRRLKKVHCERSSEQYWLNLWKRIGTQGDPFRVYKDLIVRYSEPHRAYHTLAHIKHCLDEFEQVRHLAVNPSAVELAIWFHDAIYETTGGDNEERSAALARETIGELLLPDSFGQTVESLVLATVHSIKLPADPDTQLLVDIDLSILGQSGDKFNEYERQIRKEYGWVIEGLFIAGRSATWKSFLDRPTIFSAKFFRDKYESQARQNIARSLAQLTHRPS